jgi:hypothetical protein
MPRLLPVLLTALMATACGDHASSKAAAPHPEIERLDLAEIVLHAEEAPEGTDYLPDRSFSINLEDLWPSDCCPSQQLAFDDFGFEAASAGVFQKPGYTGEPIDARPGWELVSSAAVLFETSTGASSALGSWLEYYDAPVLERLSVDGLGEEGVAIKGSPSAPSEVFYLYLWREGRAVMSLRVTAGTDSVTDEQVRELVDLMNSRVP